MSGPGPSSTTKEPVYKVTLRAKDGTSVVVDRDVAFKSEVIYTMYKVWILRIFTSDILFRLSITRVWTQMSR